MKNRICAALLTLVLCLPLAGCAGGASSGISVSYPAEPSSGADSGMQAGKAYTVGILQQMEHTSLDEIREAVEAGLARGAAAGGYTVEVVYKNAQGDPTAIRTIAEQFAAQGVDVIVPIATGAAQGAAAAAQDVPIVFSAVADPVAAGLVDAFDRTTGNITGVSNGIDVAKIFALADELTPGIGTYGFVYNEGEVNSQSIIEKAKAFLDARGLAYEEVTVASSGEVQQAARGVVAKGVDALFIPNDNTVASALPVLAQEAIAAGLPVYGTCAGLLLLAKEIEGGTPCFATMDVSAVRNAYGRQLGSFYTEAEFAGLGTIPMTFIRAPYIASVQKNVKVLATVDEKIVAARQGNQFATAFHPELNEDVTVHRYFLEEVCKGN